MVPTVRGAQLVGFKLKNSTSKKQFYTNTYKYNNSIQFFVLFYCGCKVYPSTIVKQRSNHPMLTRIGHELLSTPGKGVATSSASAMGFHLPLYGETIAGEGEGT